MNRRLTLSAAAAVLMVGLYAVHAPIVVRLPLTACVLPTAAGLALAPDAGWPVVITLSLALDALAATLLLAVGAYSPAAAGAVLAGMACAGSFARHRRPDIQVTFVESSRRS